MALPSTGQISFSQIYNEINGTFSVPSNYKLAQLAEAAESKPCYIGGTPVNFSAPYKMNDFLGMDCGQQKAFTFDITGSSFEIQFDTNDSNPLPSATIFWGDGSSTVADSTHSIRSYTHNYSSNAVYEIKIIGASLNGVSFRLTSSANKAKVLEIKEWGNFNFVGGPAHFDGCTNMIVTAQDIPQLVFSSGFRQSFKNCSSITSIPRLNEWRVQDTSGLNYLAMFEGATNWNQDISGWDITNASDMYFFAKDTAMSTENYDKLLISFANQNVKSNVRLTVTACYEAGGSRDVLIGKGWTIYDNGACPINAPSNVSAQRQSGSDYVDVTWTDNSSNEDTFAVYRTFYPNIGTQETVLRGTLYANATAFTDTGAKSTSGYYIYHVIATRNNAPNSSAAYSNSVFIFNDLGDPKTLPQQ